MTIVDKKKLVIATRGSRLALWQANHVMEQLRQHHVSSALTIKKTEGDRVLNRFLHEIGGKGLFIKELEESLAKGESDLAVHSLKDLPAKISPEFSLAAILPRHSPQDAIIFHPDFFQKRQLSKPELSKNDMKQLLPMTVATSSLRRTCLLKNLSPDIVIEPVRGNVDTRIQKLLQGKWDALILAAASLERLSEYSYLHPCKLDIKWFTPSAAQGAIAIETTKTHVATDTFRKLTCPNTEFCTQIERGILYLLGGDCRLPYGCHAYLDGQQVSVTTTVLDYAGRRCDHSATFPLTNLSDHEATKISHACFHQFQTQKGVKELLLRIKSTEPNLDGSKLS